MITKNKKTTRVSTAVTFDSALENDTGVLFAVMSGKIDSTRPFGSTTLTVHNQTIFNENEAEARAAYVEFQALVVQEAAKVQTSVVTVEGTEGSGTIIEEEP